MRPWFFLVILSSCAVGSHVVTMDAFQDVDLSAKTPEVVANLGRPYAIHHLGEGCVEYEYVERIKIGSRDAEERRYFIKFKDGAVVSKRIEATTPLPYYFDSYEMQTTQQLDTNE